MSPAVRQTTVIITRDRRATSLRIMRENPAELKVFSDHEIITENDHIIKIKNPEEHFLKQLSADVVVNETRKTELTSVPAAPEGVEIDVYE
jgi:hypothetical protein